MIRDYAERVRVVVPLFFYSVLLSLVHWVRLLFFPLAVDTLLRSF